jgi:hypothetical protein
MGKIEGPDFYRQRYSVDAVYYADEIADRLAALDAPCLHLLNGVNSDRSVIRDNVEERSLLRIWPT